MSCEVAIASEHYFDITTRAGASCTGRVRRALAPRRLDAGRPSRSSTGVQLLHHPVARGGLAEPHGAQLGRALLRREVHVHEAEAVAVAVDPFEVVHRAPLEVA